MVSFIYENEEYKVEFPTPIEVFYKQHPPKFVIQLPNDKYISVRSWLLSSPPQIGEIVEVTDVEGYVIYKAEFIN
jgi:hypothetical protein